MWIWFCLWRLCQWCGFFWLSVNNSAFPGNLAVWGCCTARAIPFGVLGFHFKLSIPEVFFRSSCISVLFKWLLKSSFSSMRFFFFPQRDSSHFLACCLHPEYDEMKLPQLLTADNWKIYSCPEKSLGKQQVNHGCIVLEGVDTEICTSWNFIGCLLWNLRNWSCNPITQQRDWFNTCFGFTQGISEEDLKFKFSRCSNIQDNEFLVYF